MTEIGQEAITRAGSAHAPELRARAVGAASSGRAALREIGRTLAPADYLAAVFVLLLIAAIVVPRLLVSYDPLEGADGQTLRAPSLTHIFGTDYLGRDLYSRLVYGTATTLAASAVAVAVGFVGGIVLGIVSGYLGGWVDAVISRLIDVLLSVPGLLLSMVIVVALGFGALNAAIAVGVSSIASFSRISRSEVLRVRGSAFVEAAQHQGSGRTRTLVQHILPNSVGPVISLIPLQFGGAIIWISSLSFLGFGAVPPQPEWGLLVSEGRQYLLAAPWLLLIPGLVIVLTVLSVSRLQQLGVGLRKAFS
jgi:peptide/nickel transport system permease protein